MIGCCYRPPAKFRRYIHRKDWRFVNEAPVFFEVSPKVGRIYRAMVCREEGVGDVLHFLAVFWNTSLSAKRQNSHTAHSSDGSVKKHKTCVTINWCFLAHILKGEIWIACSAVRRGEKLNPSHCAYGLRAPPIHKTMGGHGFSLPPHCWTYTFLQSAPIHPNNYMLVVHEVWIKIAHAWLPDNAN